MSEQTLIQSVKNSGEPTGSGRRGMDEFQRLIWLLSAQLL